MASYSYQQGKLWLLEDEYQRVEGRLLMAEVVEAIAPMLKYIPIGAIAHQLKTRRGELAMYN